MAADLRKSIREMLGELLREVGVLALVFYPIGEGIGGTVSAGRSILMGVGALGVWAGGVAIERWRSE